MIDKYVGVPEKLDTNDLSHIAIFLSQKTTYSPREVFHFISRKDMTPRSEYELQILNDILNVMSENKRTLIRTLRKARK